jgi:hypothetical protein
MVARVAGLSIEPCWLVPAQEGRDVAGHVCWGGGGGGSAHRHHLIVADRLRATGAQVVARREAGLRPFGSDQAGVGHAEGLEDVLAQVAVQALSAHVLDQLAERGEAVVGVPEAGARLGLDAQTPPVVRGEGRHGAARFHGLAEQRPEQAGGVQDLTDSGGVGQQMAHGRRPEAGLGEDQPVGAQVVVGGPVEVEQLLLPQLQHRDRGEGLGDGADPEDRVLGDGRVRGDVGGPVPGKNSRRPSRTTPTARPTAGQRLRIPLTLALSPSSSIPRAP